MSTSESFIPKGHPKCTTVVADGRYKVHCTYPDQTEMVEEYDVNSLLLLVRKWRTTTRLGGKSSYHYEIGAPPRLNSEEELLSARGPEFIRQDTDSHFCWRVFNAPWSLGTYDISVSPEERKIYIRTTNKKYFKAFSIPDLDRLNLPYVSNFLNVTWANNVLTITYIKPNVIREMEMRQRMELKKASQEQPPKEGDVACNQQ
ncbi:hypothetical protein GEMRC1_002338 [Eukaryota sp. GEM-RC1]